LVVAIKDLEEGSNVEPAQDEGINKRDADRRVHHFEWSAYFFTSILLHYVNAFSFMQISPASTLESSFEALNVKKFDGKFQAYSHYALVENCSTMELKSALTTSCFHGGSSIPSNYRSV